MRKIAILVWLLLPIVALAYHLGPGQRKLILDDAAAAIRLAQQYAADQQWARAVASYDLALSHMGTTDTAAVRRVRLEKAKAQMLAAELPAANADLKVLVDEMVEESHSSDTKLLDEARASLANSQYYRTWLMRLEGLPKEVWEPEIESARQTFRLLAESAADNESRDRYKEDLESAIRLARMDLSDLQGLPLPNQ